MTASKDNTVSMVDIVAFAAMGWTGRIARVLSVPVGLFFGEAEAPSPAGARRKGRAA